MGFIIPILLVFSLNLNKMIHIKKLSQMKQEHVLLDFRARLPYLFPVDSDFIVDVFEYLWIL